MPSTVVAFLMRVDGRDPLARHPLRLVETGNLPAAVRRLQESTGEVWSVLASFRAEGEDSRDAWRRRLSPYAVEGQADTYHLCDDVLRLLLRSWYFDGGSYRPNRWPANLLQTAGHDPNWQLARHVAFAEGGLLPPAYKSPAPEGHSDSGPDQTSADPTTIADGPDTSTKEAPHVQVSPEQPHQPRG